MSFLRFSTANVAVWWETLRLSETLTWNGYLKNLPFYYHFTKLDPSLCSWKNKRQDFVDRAVWWILNASDLPLSIMLYSIWSAFITQK